MKIIDNIRIKLLELEEQLTAQLNTAQLNTAQLNRPRYVWIVTANEMENSDISSYNISVHSTLLWAEARKESIIREWYADYGYSREESISLIDIRKKRLLD